MNSSIIGAKLVRTEYYKKEREAYLIFGNGDTKSALGVIFHPVSFGAFIVPESKAKVETSEKPWPFFQQVKGATVESVTQLGFDRIFKIVLNQEEEKYAAIVEAIGPNANLWLLDHDDMIMATLRHKKYDESKSYSPPPGGERLNPMALDIEKLKEALGKHRDLAPDIALKKCIVGLDDILANEVANRADIKSGSPVGDLNSTDIRKILGAISEITAKFTNDDRGYVWNLAGHSFAYPFKLKSLPAEPEKFGSLSLAVLAAIRNKKDHKIEISEKEEIIGTISRSIAKLQRKIVGIEQDLATADRYDEYRLKAELLKINLRNINKGAAKVSLEDKYGSGAEVVIKLDPALSPSENAEDYFKKYRKGKEALDLLKRRLEITRQELASSKEMLNELERNYDQAYEKYHSEIASVSTTEDKKKAIGPRLPYKPFTLASGVTIFVGRDGEDNDRTTFAYAKPYELWFHTSQCPGSHVVMKFPDKNFKPSKAEIVEAASVAAYYSKARKSKTVPVIYTERKYVRKPRKAKPGLVTVEKEKMVMVEPKKID